MTKLYEEMEGERILRLTQAMLRCLGRDSG